ncbi:hypothetical protein WA158_005800 [Blastocystis sp. Blastoise]
MSKQCFSFIIWPGSKRRFASQIADIIQTLPNEKNEFPTYVEPFIGSGHVFLNIIQQDIAHGIIGRQYVINDTNTDLINCWKFIRNFPMELMQELEKISFDEDNTENYYNLRKVFNECKEPFLRSVYFIALNKKCFCGVYSVNKKGEFNTPWGYNKNRRLYNEKIILNISSFLNLNDVLILNEDYKTIIKMFPKAIYYMDPPYLGTFDRYSKDKFSNDEFLENVKTMKDATGVYISCNNDMKDTFDKKDIKYTEVLSFCRQNTYIRSKGAKYDEYLLHINY